MNKRFFINTLAALMLATPAFASYQAVPRAQVAQYAEASMVALQRLDLSCTTNITSSAFNVTSGEILFDFFGIHSNALSAVIDEAYVNTAGAQPLIKLIASLTDTRIELELETNSARTQVISFKTKKFERTRVNAGTLDQPNMIDGWVQLHTYDCRVR